MRNRIQTYLIKVDSVTFIPNMGAVCPWFKRGKCIK